MSVEQKEHTLVMGECADLVRHYCEQLAGYVDEVSDAAATEELSKDGVRAVLARVDATFDELEKLLCVVDATVELIISD